MRSEGNGITIFRSVLDTFMKLRYVVEEHPIPGTYPIKDL
jgi:hypothetical protein